MEINPGVFNNVFKVLAQDIVKKLSEALPYEKISIKNENLKIEDIVVLQVNDKEYNFDLNAYIDECVACKKEKIVFDNLVDNIKEFILGD